MMGKPMILLSTETMANQTLTENGKGVSGGIASSGTKMYLFEEEDGRRVILTEAETRAYMYYPFCMFTGGIVGHTFTNYTMVILSCSSSTYYDYADTRAVLSELERRCSGQAWLSPVCKTLNVVVSRVRTGSTVKVLEIGGGRAQFWRPMLTVSEWHLLGRRRHVTNTERYGNVLTQLRESIVDAMNNVVVNKDFDKMLSNTRRR